MTVQCALTVFTASASILPSGSNAVGRWSSGRLSILTFLGVSLRLRRSSLS